jgi:hypothetical protein
MDTSPETCFFEKEHGYIAVKKSSTCHRCTLCQLDIPFAECTNHIEDEKHKSAREALAKVAANEQILYKRRIEALSWESRISKQHPTSTQAIYQAMLDYVTDCNAGKTAVTVLLGRWESIERVALIRLVVWKAMCIISVPHNMTFRTVLDCHAWVSSGWKVLKEEMRDSSSVKAVVSVVASYLDASKCMGKAKKVLSERKPTASESIMKSIQVKDTLKDFEDKEGNSAKKAAKMEDECHTGSRLMHNGRASNVLTQNAAIAESSIMTGSEIKYEVGDLDVLKEKECGATKIKDIEGQEHDKDMNIEQEKTRIVSEERFSTQEQSPKVKPDNMCKNETSSCERKQERYKCQCQIM